MRVDDKKEGPRQSMSWLHTWISLLLGWLLYAIFLTGTLSFFQNEITIWMKPELHQSLTNQTQQQQLTTALDMLQKTAPEAGGWTINLPTARQTTTGISIQKVNEQQGQGGGGRRGGQTYDTATGEEIKARETRGGGFLYRFHFELYGMERNTARWIVGIATMFMFVAIISGIITHKKIFKDFFTFRPSKGQRSWLDAHNATAVFALPFHIMITFSGLLLLMFTIMPYGVNQVYEGGRREYLAAQNSNSQQQAQRDQSAANSTSQNGEKTNQIGMTNGESQAQRSERSGDSESQRGENSVEGRMTRGEGQGQRGERSSNPEFQRGENSSEGRIARGEGQAQRSERSGNPESQRGENSGEGRIARGEGQAQRSERSGNSESQRRQNSNDGSMARAEGQREGRFPEHATENAATAVMTDIPQLLTYVQKQWAGNHVISSVIVTEPNTVNAQVEIRAVASESLVHRNQTPSFKFNAVSGELIAQEKPEVKTSIPSAIYNLTTWLHQARGVSLGLRWLLFLSGILGTLMVATGLILWVVKRQPEIQKLGYKPWSHRIVEILNVPTVVGLTIACAAYFWANRLIPAQLEGRTDVEIKVFFIVWLITLIHSAIRPYRKAWLEQLALSGILFLLIPILNALTGGRGLWSSIYYGQWVVANFDLACLLIAAVLLYSYYKLKHYPQMPVRVKKTPVRPKLESKTSSVEEA